MRVTLVQAPTFDWSTPSNSLALMAAHLRRAGLSPRVHDASMNVLKRLRRARGREFEHIDEYVRAADASEGLVRGFVADEAGAIASGDPDVVAFSVLTFTENWSLDLARRVKELKPGCRVVFGGPQCLRETLAGDFVRHPAVDAVVLGEGDRTFPRFLQSLDPASASLPRVPGVLLKDGAGIFDGGDPEPIEDLDTLPYLDFGDFRMEDYSGNRVYLSTSRGCVRKCSFCGYIVQQKTYREMSPRRTVAEIKHQMALYPERTLVDFNDSLVNGNVRRLAAVSDLLIDYRKERLVTHAGLDFGWTGMAILHPTMVPTLLRKMRWGGCRVLRYGLESGSQKVVDLMRKNFKVADAERVIRDTHAEGIEALLFILVGFPGETESDFRLTLDFIERNRPFISGAQISTCDIQKGTQLDVQAGPYGVRLPVEDGVRWASIDGGNTYEVRQDRARRVYELLDELELPVKRVSTGRIGDFVSVPA